MSRRAIPDAGSPVGYGLCRSAVCRLAGLYVSTINRIRALCEGELSAATEPQTLDYPRTYTHTYTHKKW